MDNVSDVQKSIQEFLATIKIDMKNTWSTLTPYTQESLKLFNVQDWRDFVQVLLEKSHEEYQALDGYYLPPKIVHIVQEELDKFTITFSQWFKENFNAEEKNEKEH